MRSGCVVAAGLLAALAACGPGERATGAARAPGAAPASEGSGPSAPASAPPGSTAHAGSAQASATMRAPQPSEMEASLRELGLDPTALPPMEKLDAKALRGVMNTFTKALGVSCGHCHEKSDFRAATANKRVATRMWNEFARGLAPIGGGTLYCDSCHGGRPKVLDRHDGHALGAWMHESYVESLVRTDGKDHGCATCHGDPFEGKILSTRWK